MSLEEIYNKWQLQDLDLGNTEPYQFTKSELLDFAKYYHTKKFPIQRVSQQRELLIAFLEMNNWLSLEDEENAKGVVDCYLEAINCC